jgi:hypothetical protein
MGDVPRGKGSLCESLPENINTTIYIHTLALIAHAYGRYIHTLTQHPTYVCSAPFALASEITKVGIHKLSKRHGLITRMCCTPMAEMTSLAKHIL